LSSAKAAVETYNIDPVHTWVGFSVAHFFTKVPALFWQGEGTIVVDRNHLENSTVEAAIEVASITTNTKMRDDDLRSTNFLCRRSIPGDDLQEQRLEKHRRQTPTPSLACSR